MPGSNKPLEKVRILSLNIIRQGMDANDLTLKKLGKKNYRF